jgi:death on curing protein
MIQHLTPEQVLFLHSRLIAETGGMHGVRDLSMLLSALARPQATFEDKEFYPDLFSKTACLMDSLVRNHPFVDGNKRTAITSAGIFLWINGYRLRVENDEMVCFTLACAQSQLSLPEIIEWFTKFSSPEGDKQ